MFSVPATAFAATLSSPDYGQTAAFLAASWFDQTILVRLAGVGPSRPDNIGGHLRRSFLGALAQGASAAAKSGQPCTWDPPCALDVFCREQLRSTRGDGLSKPYVIFSQADGPDLLVYLRVFGMANDWLMRAAEALVHGVENILPWTQLYPGRKVAPAILDRQILISPALTRPPVDTVVLNFISPVDASGKNLRATPHSLLTRMLRRVDAVSRWNGVALTETAARALAAQARSMECDPSGLCAGRYEKPNRFGQSRVNTTMSGQFRITGATADFWPVLLIAERAHVGRGSVEGLGRFELDWEGRDAPG